MIHNSFGELNLICLCVRVQNLQVALARCCRRRTSFKFNFSLPNINRPWLKTQLILLSSFWSSNQGLDKNCAEAEYCAYPFFLLFKFPLFDLPNSHSCFPLLKKWIIFIIVGVINALRQIAGIFLTLATYKLETLHYYVNVAFLGGGISQYAASGGVRGAAFKNNSYLLPSGAILNDNCVGVSLISTNKVFFSRSA